MRQARNKEKDYLHHCGLLRDQKQNRNRTLVINRKKWLFIRFSCHWTHGTGMRYPSCCHLFQKKSISLLSKQRIWMNNPSLPLIFKNWSIFFVPKKVFTFSHPVGGTECFPAQRNASQPVTRPKNFLWKTSVPRIPQVGSFSEPQTSKTSQKPGQS